MPTAFILLKVILFSLHIPVCSAMGNSISAGEALIGDDKLISPKGRFALGFFQLDSTSRHWYLGIWFHKISTITPIWVANRESPIVGHQMVSKLTISNDGNLAILHQPTKSTIWSTHANITAKNTSAVLLDSGNLILGDASNSSDVLWQSFDYPTDALLLDAKFGLDKVTGLNRRLVSKKNLVNPAPGRYCAELDPTGAAQFLLTLCNTSLVYASSGEWNGHYFKSMPEMSGAGQNLFEIEFVNSTKEEIFRYNLLDESAITITFLDSSGLVKSLFWLEQSQEWGTVYTYPKDQCDVYATCGPFTVCKRNSSPAPACDCMKGFSIRSPKDWENNDQTGGCIRTTPLDCGTSNQSRTGTSDKFYPMVGVKLPENGSVMEVIGSRDQCAKACLYNCSCNAYSYGNRCSLWYDDLLDFEQEAYASGGQTLYLRISAKHAESWIAHKRGKGMIIGSVIAGSVVALGFLSFLIWFLLIWRNKRKQSTGMSNSVQAGNGIVAFRYTDLQRATRNFSDKLGGGSFGSVFKGLLSNSTAIAVKRLDGICQGEKEFRAEVSSIGIIHHINLVKLIGFCCEGNKRLLVYEHMPNGSLDAHLFRSNTTVLNWGARYKIALGIARGLAYLHERCRDCIIHCDIKPENILLDASFLPKVADFGMAKFLGRDYSRVLTTSRGTIGYLAPEWISGVAITPKVDVYSYGMMLLEIVSGRRNICSGDHLAYFPMQVASRLLEGDAVSLLDDKLLCDFSLDEAERVCKVACWCIQDDEPDRPTMGEVVQVLEGLIELETPPVPRLLQAIVGSRCELSYSPS